MKSFLFDVWGAGIPFAEEFCATAQPNTALMSAATQELLAASYSGVSEPVAQLELGGTPVTLHQLVVTETLLRSLPTSIATAQPMNLFPDCRKPCDTSDPNTSNGVTSPIETSDVVTV